MLTLADVTAEEVDPWRVVRRVESLPTWISAAIALGKSPLLNSSRTRMRASARAFRVSGSSMLVIAAKPRRQLSSFVAAASSLVLIRARVERTILAVSAGPNQP